MKKRGENIYYKTSIHSPIGKITMASDGENLIGMWTEGQKNFDHMMSKEMVTNDFLGVFTTTKEWLKRYFNGLRPEISEIPLSPNGGEFRQEVWEMLREIPYGEVVTYGELALKIAEKRGFEKMSPQAIGGAVSHNPILIIIPCHRVVGANGNLTGYSGGVEMKLKLLQQEGVDTSRFKMPFKRKEEK